MVGDGQATSYWRDPWNGKALIDLLPQGDKATHPHLSLRDAYPIRFRLHSEAEQVPTNNLIFTDDRDTMRWRWTMDGSYTASSIYRLISEGGKIKSNHNMVWRLPIPPTVRIFAYLLLKCKILTQDVMQVRNMGTDDGCQICQNCPTESALHLIFLCPVAVQVWCELTARVGFRLMQPAQSVDEIWEKSRVHARLLGKEIYKQWQSLFMCACWHMWKRRNDKIFSGRMTATQLLADRIVQEGRLWLKYCNRSTRIMMGTNLLPEPD